MRYALVAHWRELINAQKKSFGVFCSRFFLFPCLFVGDRKAEKFCSVNHFLKPLPVERDEEGLICRDFFLKILYHLSLNLTKPKKV